MGNYTRHYLLLKVKEKKILPGKIFKVYLFIFLAFLGINTFSQSIKVSGTVTDSDSGDVIPSVSIILKGTEKGTLTDFDGKFSIIANKANDILVFSYLGYKTKEVNLAGKKVLNISLSPDEQQLDEIVIIGYGSSKKSDLTGSIVSIGGEALKTQPISDISQALTGRLAGVQITSTEGSPDAEALIRVRGNGSITQNASPLLIVDGFPVSSISDISPNDIENLSVLKDASSTAIYGSRGAGGVVIITTKSGKKGKIAIDINSFYGMSKVAKTIDVLAPEDYVKWQYEHALLRDTDDALSQYESLFGLWQDYDQYIGMEGNNWQKQIFGRTGEVESRDLTVRGGSEKASFSFNYSLFDNKAIMIGSDFRRDNISLGLKSELSDKLDLSLKLRYSDVKINGGGANEQNEQSSSDSRARHFVGYSPIPIQGLTSSSIDDNVQSDLVYPFTAVDDNQRKQYRKNYNLQGSLSWKIIDNLKFKTQIGLNYRDDLDYRYYGRSTYYASDRTVDGNQGKPSLIFSNRKRNGFRSANTLDFNFKDILNDENHTLKLLVGEEVIINKDSRLTNVVQGYPLDFDINKTINLTNQGNAISTNNFNNADDKLLSFFGRVNYDFMNRYLLTSTYRIDGSSKFLGDNRWGHFKSAALGWKISEEPFLESADGLDLLKFRFSYGEAGNNNIPVAQTVRNFFPFITTYLNGITNYTSASRSLPNPDLKWETTVTRNYGLDFGFLNNRITGSLEYYNNTTNDLLINFPIPGSGYDTQYRNMGEIQNKGIEASLNIAVLDKPDYGLNFSFNIAKNKNRVNSLGLLQNFGTPSGWASSEIDADYLVQTGSPIGIIYGYLNDGRYEVSDFNYDSTTETYTLKDGVAKEELLNVPLRPGNMKLKDLNGDGLVNIDDRTIIGDVNPDFTGGFVLNGNAYGFDFSAAFNFSVGNDVYNADKIEFSTARNQYRNLSSIMADGNRWTNLDPSTGQLVTDPVALEALNANTTMWSPYMRRRVLTDWAVEDASFLRLNTLTLGYTIPDALIEKAGITRLRFYTTATNVFVLTNYSGSDPEVSTRRKTPLTPAMDSSPYPRNRQIVFGFNLSF